MIPTRRPATPVLLAGVLVFCACGRETRVDVVAALEPGRPLAGLKLVAWPYDPQRLLDSLAELAPVPRPDFSELEAELLAFVRPEFQVNDAATRAWAAVRDSVRQLSDSLLGADDRASASYRAAYERFRRLYERLLLRTANRDAGVRDLTSEVRELATRAGRAADSLRAWEREAYADADSAAAWATAAAGKAAVTGMVDEDGRAEFRLPRGRWWIEGRAPHPDNPFLEYRWGVALVAGGIPFRVPITGWNAREVWRY